MTLAAAIADDIARARDLLRCASSDVQSGPADQVILQFNDRKVGLSKVHRGCSRDSTASPSVPIQSTSRAGSCHQEDEAFLNSSGTTKEQVASILRAIER